MNSIIPKAITNLFKNNINIDDDIMLFMVTNYSEFLLTNNIHITGVQHSVVRNNKSITMINWKQGSEIKTTPLIIFFIENLCTIRMRQYKLNCILND